MISLGDLDELLGEPFSEGGWSPLVRRSALAEALVMSERTVSRSIGALEAHGLLRVRRRGPRGMQLCRGASEETAIGPAVYAVQCEVTGLIKLGHSTDIRSRLSTLRTISPTPLRLVATFPGDPDREAELHSEFEDHRDHGEWFAPAPDLLAFLGIA